MRTTFRRPRHTTRVRGGRATSRENLLRTHDQLKSSGPSSGPFADRSRPCRPTPRGQGHGPVDLRRYRVHANTTFEGA